MATMQEKLKEKLEEIPERKLAIFTVSCHKDRALISEIVASRYEIPIQAGAALTKQRTQIINDYDDVEDTISDKNSVYSEMTAAYWIWKNVDVPYVGLDHYRRRFKVSDEQLEQWIEEDVDVISTIPGERYRSLKEEYEIFHFAKDWEIMENTFRSLYPSDYEKALHYIEKSCMHGNCMGIFRKEIYDECCRWVFSILDRVYEQRVEKVDKYQHRDVSFLAERLMSIYIDLHKDEWNYREVGIETVPSDVWKAENECDLSDENEVLIASKRLLAEQRIDHCFFVLNDALVNNNEIAELKRIIGIYMLEKSKLKDTMFERNKEFCDYNKLINHFRHMTDLFDKYCISFDENYEREIIHLFNDKISSYCFLSWLEYDSKYCTEVFLNQLAMAFLDENMILESLYLLNLAVKNYPDSDITYFNLAFLAAKIGDKNGAVLYLEKIQNQQDEMVIELKNYIWNL